MSNLNNREKLLQLIAPDGARHKTLRRVDWRERFDPMIRDAIAATAKALDGYVAVYEEIGTDRLLFAFPRLDGMCEVILASNTWALRTGGEA
jgi:hypothetical protein